MSRLSLLLIVLLIPSLALNVYLLSTKMNNASLRPVTTLTQTTAGNKTTVSNIQVSEKPHNKSHPASSPSEKQIPKVLADLTVEQLTALAQRYFEQQQFEQAVTVYEELTLRSEHEAQNIYQNWLEQLNTWSSEEKFQPLDAFIDNYSLRFPYDAPILSVKANALALRDQPQQAIQLFQDLLSYTYEQSQQEYYQARIRHIANDYITVLIENLAWQQLIDFSETLLQQDSNYPPHVLAYSLGLVELDNLDAAESQLQPILQISFYEQQAKQLINRINKLRLHQTAIRLQPAGAHYLVTGQINRTSPITLMIDTGASLSVITQSLFDQISPWANPVFERETLFNTAGGQVRASIYRFESFEIEEFMVEDIAFAVMELDNFAGYDGLLGMNFLKQFIFQIDQQEHLLILSPK